MAKLGISPKIVNVNRKLFWPLFTLLLVFQFVIRIIPPQNNNFYFTVDQGNDVVHVREIVERGALLTKGPETSIPGVFAGPGWYYFLAPGYFLFNGHPAGGVFMLILLSLFTTALIVWWVSRRVSPWAGLVAGLVLQGYWYFYELSRYEFNPFPTGILALWQIFLLADFLAGKKKSYFWALLPIILAFNTAVATAAAMALLHLVVGVWGIRKELLTLRQYVLFNFVVPLTFAMPIIVQLAKQFSQSSLVQAGVVGERGFFASTNFLEIGQRFSEIFTRSVVPVPFAGSFGGPQQSLIISIIVVTIALYFLFRARQKHYYVINYLILLSLFWLISYLFFGSNKAWREWHTLYLYLLTFLGLILVLVSVPQKLGLLLLGLVLASQIFLFQERYRQYLAASDDPGILVNQLKVLDWIYQNSEGDGFNVYTYSPHVYDYQNQYLFWWYGRQKYGFIPCEYSLYPGFMKYNYIPSPQNYARPTLGCDKFRFLLIEPGGDEKSYFKWREQIKFGRGEKVDEAEVGQFRVEKWRIRPRT